MAMVVLPRRRLDHARCLSWKGVIPSAPDDSRLGLPHCVAAFADEASFETIMSRCARSRRALIHVATAAPGSDFLPYLAHLRSLSGEIVLAWCSGIQGSSASIWKPIVRGVMAPIAWP